MDDGLLDLTLLRRASKVAVRSSRSVNATSKSISRKTKNALLSSVPIEKSGSVSSSSDSDLNEFFHMADTIALIDPSSYTPGDKQNSNGIKDGNSSKEGAKNKADGKGGNDTDGSEQLNGWPTFKDMTDSESPACPDILIDIMVEIATLNSDLKLMLRAMNCREMASQLRKEKKHLNAVLLARERKNLSKQSLSSSNSSGFRSRSGSHSQAHSKPPVSSPPPLPDSAKSTTSTGSPKKNSSAISSNRSRSGSFAFPAFTETRTSKITITSTTNT
ncbi:unnamed protein product [Ambrosiozyma monospora]|uniref:Unnamed protein product n=1 Tax=Ambrosiozyma monospora TaxID=43982 RepID=A0ACB5TQP3_AMBMO|nr:unnamed protein product [Ambrosiozyma monospora]